jgi:hypothetical protein
MSLERRQPLPPGRYWIDVVGKPHDLIFKGWALGFRDHVHFESEDLTPELGPVVPSPGAPVVRPQVHWYLFNTDAPLVWLGPALGFPTIATPDVKTKADTANRPPAPAGFFDGFSFDGAGAYIALAALVYLVWKPSR